MRSRERPTENDNSEALSWHITRLHAAKGSLFKDIPDLRDQIGEGSYGIVYKAVDQSESISILALDEQPSSLAEAACCFRNIP